MTVLIFATTTGYQTRMFEAAAARLGVDIVYATDRCDHLDDPWRDGAIAVRYSDEVGGEGSVLAALAGRVVDGVLAVGDRPAVLAARVAAALDLSWHPPLAAAAARDKRLTRTCLEASGLPVPAWFTVPSGADPASLVDRLPFPVVIKPTMLSASRGVMRADDGAGFVRAFARLQRLLATPEVRQLQDPAAEVVQVEQYIPGAEFAVEGLMTRDALRVLAVFDKPDPLEGPFFEETIYVTPSRVAADMVSGIETAVTRAARSLGLAHGPIHAECRVNDAGVFVLEVAPRPIGGLCAKVLRFTGPNGERAGLEEVILRHAMGEPTEGWLLEAGASAVMMIPIPKAGLFRRVDGLDEARAVAGVDEVTITAKPDQRLVPLPEGASYLGFIFAHAPMADAAERAVRDAHARLRFAIEGGLEVLRS